jgi:hypothetical protein
MTHERGLREAVVVKKILTIRAKERTLLAHY